MKSLSWAVVKKELLKEEKLAFKEMLKGKKKNPSKKLEGLAKEVGWLDVISTQWRIETKRSLWKDIHRDIVSTLM